MRDHMMNQQKECLEFIDKKIPQEIGATIKKILEQIESKNSTKKKWSAPAIAKFPEESDVGKWTIWWTSKNKELHLSLDFYNEKEFYFFWRDRKGNVSLGEECNIDLVPDELSKKIFEMKFGWEKEDYDGEDDDAA